MSDLPPPQPTDESLPPLDTERRSGKPVSFYLALFLGLLLLVSAGLNLVLLAVSVFGSAAAGLGGLDDPNYEVVTVAGESDADAKILRVPVTGAIAEQASPLIGASGGSVTSVERALRYAAREESIRGVLLDIDSPGGGVTASDKIYRLLKDFRAESDKPIVALFNDLAASGGYYVAMAADHIIAHPTTTTGSIGVILSQFDLSKAAKELGVGQTTITSGPNKDMLSMFEPASQEQLDILQSIVDDMYDQFVDVVVDGRPKLAESRIRELADGRVYSAGQALNAGLVDQVGYLDDAVQKLSELCKTDKVHIVEQRRRPGLGDLLLGATADHSLAALAQNATSARFLYWWPGGR